MKKFIALLLAVLCIMSSFAVVSYADTTTYTCDYCSKTFSTESALNDHMAANLNDADHKITCPGCGVGYTISQFKDHAASCAGIKSYVCDFCGKTFSTTSAIKAHIEETFAVDGHLKQCTNGKDLNGDGDYNDEDECYCGHWFTTKVAYEAHAAVCSCKDSRSNADKMVDAFKAGNIEAGFKYLLKTVLEFLKSDSFKSIFDKVVAFFKSLDLSSLKSTITTLAGKIPFDKITSLFSK